MKKLISLFLVLIATASIILAQSVDQEARCKYNIKQWNDLVKSNFDKVRKENRLDQCMTSVTFAKFNIDTLGNVINLDISELPGSSPVFKEILTGIINATKGAWIPATFNGKPITSKLFILPFIYNLEAGCKTQDVKNHNTTYNALAAFFQSTHHDRNEPITAINCILLEPVYYYSNI